MLGATSWVDKGLVSEAFGPKNVAKSTAKIHPASLPSGAKFDRCYTQLYSQGEAQVLAKYYHEASLIYEGTSGSSFRLYFQSCPLRR